MKTRFPARREDSGELAAPPAGRRSTASALFAVGAAAAMLGACAAFQTAEPAGDPSRTVWRFDRLDTIGDLPVSTEGEPRLVTTPAGAAVLFDGVDDALFVPAHPLAEARSFTFEAIFRPDGGAFEQRWFHLAEADPAAPTGQYPPVRSNGPRFLFEIRVVPGGWYLDAFAAGPSYSKALMAPEKLHELGRWHHVAQTFDGRAYRSYVNGRLQAESPLAFVPQGAGYSSVGTRINRRNYFRGAVYSARFTHRALTPAEFMSLPRGLR